MVLVIVGTTTGTLAAQRAQPSALWLDMSAGAGHLGYPFAASIAVHGGYYYQRGPSLFSFRAAEVVDELGALLFAFGASRNAVAASDVGLLYGRARRPGHGFAAISAGLGVAKVFSGGTGRATYHLGLPLEGQLAWRPVRAIGLEILGFADFNRGHSFSGLTVGLQLGRLY
jgi:hypothetical protein